MSKEVRKAVILAGGEGTRLKSIKHELNKHCLPVYDRTMIEHVVELVVSAGVIDVLVLLNNKYPQTIMEILEDGERYGCSIYYRYLNECSGPGRELFLAEDWVGDDNFLLITGDSLYVVPLKLNDISVPHMWVMPLNGLDDVWKYARVIEERGHVKSFVKNGNSGLSQVGNLIQTGAWVFGREVFTHVRRLNMSNVEVRVRDVVEAYIEGGSMTCTVLPGDSFIDLGTPEAYRTGCNMVAELRRRQSFFSRGS